MPGIINEGNQIAVVLLSTGVAAGLASKAMDGMEITKFEFGGYVDSAWAVGSDTKVQMRIGNSGLSRMFVKVDANIQTEMKAVVAVSSGFSFKVTWENSSYVTAKVAGIDIENGESLDTAAFAGKATETADKVDVGN